MAIISSKIANFFYINNWGPVILTVAGFEKSKVITELLNDTNIALQTTIPLNDQLNKPTLLGKSLKLQFGILIGVTSDIKASLLLMEVPSAKRSCKRLRFRRKTTMAKILVTDDAAFMRMQLRDILTKLGHEVIGEAETGKIAIQKYRNL